MTPSIKVENLSKLYRLGAASNRPSDSLKEAITQMITSPFKGRGNNAEPEKGAPGTEAEWLWALKEVSFEAHPGEVVGIIGRNGAGKSTLLKILSRITPPTSGSVSVYGSMASLLEVGTGFHPELSGRENIFLNGAILGMSRATIRAKFDEIIAFAEIERFLDTPVKHYSSGMYVRLAFAVAAHLEPEVLLVDEVLAVGDVPFQKKCLSKMGDVAGRGRTVLFVSHNLFAVRQLCTRCILIDGGKIVADGPTPQTLRTFNDRLRNYKIDANAYLKQRLEGHSGIVRFTSFRIEDATGNEKYDFHPGDTIRIAIDYEAFEDAPDLLLYFALVSDTSGETVTSVRYELATSPLKKGQKGSAKIELPNVALTARDYLPYIWLGSRGGNPYDRLNYSLTNCPPLSITRATLGPTQDEGYFSIASRLVG